MKELTKKIGDVTLRERGQHCIATLCQDCDVQKSAKTCLGGAPEAVFNKEVTINVEE